MTIVFLEAMMQLFVLIPFVVLVMKERCIKCFIRIGIFSVVFVLYSCVIMLGGEYDAFHIINSNWNWNGKIYGVFFGIICYYIFRKYFKEYDFFTHKQAEGSNRSVWIATIGITVLAVMGWLLAGSGGEWNLETLAFQLTLPGIEEEIMFRGVLMGLLLSSLKTDIKYLGNPSNLFLAILFGFVHAFTLSKEYKVSFNTTYFIQTGFAGYVYGWIAIKSRSIVFPILAHNATNFFGTLVMMVK